MGDIILDGYASGDVERISPEAPVPIMRHLHHHEVPGGSANVAMNIVALGGSVSLVGIVGTDGEGERLTAMLSAAHIEDRMIRTEDRPTTFKLRILAGKHQMLRVDKEISTDIGSDLEEKLIDTAIAEMRGVDALVLSDYRKGCLTERVLRETIDAARLNGIPIFVDPKRTDYSAYRGADYVTPNRTELKAATGISCSDNEACKAAAAQAMAQCGANILLTLSEQGMVLFQSQDDDEWLPTEAKEVFDVSGAGDSVIAAFAYSIVSGLPVSRALRIANVTAGIVIAKAGTATASESEVLEALDRTYHQDTTGGELLPLADAIKLRERWREQGLVVGLTNGCFDLIHPGHLKLLAGAAAPCDRLIVAINSDQSVKRLKGETRPVQDQTSRAQVMGAIRYVDAVVIFEEDTPLRVIEGLKPNILVKGSDYEENQIVGAEFVRANGGDIVRIDLEEGHSTTNLVKRGGVAA